jgi:hypothetical protein
MLLGPENNISSTRSLRADVSSGFTSRYRIDRSPAWLLLRERIRLGVVRRDLDAGNCEHLTGAADSEGEESP